MDQDGQIPYIAPNGSDAGVQSVGACPMGTTWGAHRHETEARGLYRWTSVTDADGAVWWMLCRQASTELAGRRGLWPNDGALYRIIFDGAEDSMFTIDRAGHFVTVNAATEAMTDYASDVLVGRHFSSLVVARDLPVVDRIVQRVLQGLKTAFECAIRTRAGVERVVRVEALPVVHEGHAVGVFGVARDITQHTQRDQVLHLQRDLLQRVAKGLPIDAALQAVVNGLREVFPGAGASVMLVHAQDRRLYHAASVAMPDAYLATINGVDVRRNNGIAATAVIRRQLVTVQDLLADPITERFGPQLVQYGFQSAWAVPIFGAGDAVDGVLVVYHYGQRRLSAVDEDLMQGWSSLLGLLLDRCDPKTWQTPGFRSQDGLTGLLPRAQIQAVVERKVAEAKGPVTLFVLDIDRFKQINDAYGHRVGDRVIATVGDRLRALGQAGMTVGRLGDDEFLIVVDGCNGTDGASGQRIGALFQSPIQIDDRTIRVTVSIGGVCFPAHGETADLLLSRADLALSAAKRDGRDTVQMYQATWPAHPRDRVARETQLQQAFSRPGEFFAAFQPRWEVSSGGLAGAEALARWHRPEDGWLPPSEFIPLAEDTGLIIPLTTHMLDQAAQLLQQTAGASWRVSVNLSPLYFRRRRVVDDVRSLAARYQVPLTRFEIELVESTIAEYDARMAQTLADCAALGITVALDDFGTGLSSLARLQSLPLDFLKIDQTFVRGIGSPRSEAILKAIVTLAHSLDLQVVAEGVESAEEHAFLAAIGCDQVQGFLLGHPVPAPEFVASYGGHRPRS